MTFQVASVTDSFSKAADVRAVENQIQLSTDVEDTRFLRGGEETLALVRVWRVRAGVMTGETPNLVTIRGKN